ncbi:MAG TPA: ABC transporter ATP-binding protein [Pseudonocardiaceae bacterium]|nr:ABC transporter ATP-binding protein [Pseudonocardiaceae bacterium]
MESVGRVHGTAANAVSALMSVTLSVEGGTFTAVMGPSGSARARCCTARHGLDRPTSGRVFLDGAELSGRGEGALTRFRRQRVGFVFQQFNLLPTLTALQNVLLPLRLAGRPADRERCVEALRRVGLADRLDHRPSELSGGQQQRVAIARAMAAEPKVIFAYEPTGALDSHAAHDVLALLRQAVDRWGQTVVMVTHDPVAAAHADTVLFLRDGRLAGRLTAPTPQTATAQLSELGA